MTEFREHLISISSNSEQLFTVFKLIKVLCNKCLSKQYKWSVEISSLHTSIMSMASPGTFTSVRHKWSIFPTPWREHKRPVGKTEHLHVNPTIVAQHTFTPSHQSMAILLPDTNSCFFHGQLPLNQTSNCVSGRQNFIKIVKMFSEYSNKYFCVKMFTFVQVPASFKCYMLVKVQM